MSKHPIDIIMFAVISVVSFALMYAFSETVSGTVPALGAVILGALALSLAWILMSGRPTDVKEQFKKKQ